MTDTANWLIHDHSKYEDLLAEFKDTVAIEDWKDADQLFRLLVTNLKGHMAMEEEVLYPAYEQASHLPQGPTQALRHEHDQIVKLVEDINRVIKTRDSTHMLDCVTYLEKCMIKHHEKEEDIFLPLASHVLDSNREAIMQKLNTFDASTAQRKWKL
jgi:iron-sulfur cluster repair protein YtfE (RIC family)